MAIGRPKKYSKKTLERAVEAYFDSIRRRSPVLDASGEAATNDVGETITRLEYLVPPSVAGLCVYLEIDRSTWGNYCKDDNLADVTNWAKLRIEAYLSEELMTRESNVRGIIFNLENNYGWHKKTEVEIGKETRKAAASETMSIKEKLALIREVSQLRAEDLDGDPP